MEENENDFCCKPNGFFYTSEKYIDKMDDRFILSKITEKYPDFNQDSSENMLKQVVILIASDDELMENLHKNYDIDPMNMFKVIYRNYEYLFNNGFMGKVQKTIRSKKHATNAHD